jgi:glycosyltransferase involved in cell wall biosynthesis
MRALLVSDSYPPLIGGATLATRELARALRDRGHSVCVATSWQKGAPASEAEDEIAVRRVRAAASRLPGALVEPRYTPPPFPDPELVVRLRRLIGSFRPDVIHTYGWISASVVVALSGHKIPLVLAGRDYGNICPRRTMLFEGVSACSGPGWRKCLSCSAQEYGVAKGAMATVSVLSMRAPLRRRVTGIHAVSGYVSRLMTGGLMSGSGAVSTIIAPDWRQMPGERLAHDERELARLPSRPYILYVGAFRMLKGIDQLLRAYEALGTEVPLVAVGTPAPDTPPFPADVIVLESLSYAAVLEAWDGALFGVAPSVLPEPLGNVIHEGMSRGRPVIGTTPGGHSDMIEDGVSGMLVAGGDVAELTRAMKAMISDEKGRLEMGRQAEKSARRFTRDHVAPALVDFLERQADSAVR